MAGSIANAVKVTGATVTTVTTGAVTTTSGNTFVVDVCHAPGVTANVPTDSKGNTYTIRGTTQSTGAIAATRFVCENGAGGSGHTVTQTFSASTFPSVFFLEVAGVLAASFDTGSRVQVTDSATPFTVTSGTLAQADEIVLVLCSGDSSSNPATFTESTGFTIALSETDGTQFWHGAVAYKVVSATTALTPSFTSVGAAAAVLHIAGFQAAPTAPVFTTHPISQSVAAGAAATFTAAATFFGTGTGYQWQDNSTGVFANISGATSSSYTTSATGQAFQGRLYRVVATDSNGSTTSLTAELGVIGFPVYLWPTNVQSGNDVWLRDPTAFSAGGGGTFALTGVSATASAGTVAPTNSLALTGAASTSAPGAVAPSLAASLTGAASTASAGAVAPSLVIALTGVQAAASAGTVTASAGVTVALTGAQATGQAGTLAPDNSVPLTGIAATSAAGTLAPASVVAITGAAATSSAGAVAPSTSTALTGAVATSSAGSVAPSTVVALTGAQATAQAGTVAPSQQGTSAITGVQAETSAGAVSSSLDTSITGVAATASAGSVSPAVVVSLTGVQATGLAGNLNAALSVPVSGAQATAQAGNVTVQSSDITIALTGVQANTQAGSVTPSGGDSTAPTPAGGWDDDKPRKKRRLLIEIDGKTYEVTADQLRALEKQWAEEAAAKAIAEARAATVPVRTARPIPPRIVGAPQSVIDQARNEYRKAYEAAVKRAREDEEDDISMILMNI